MATSVDELANDELLRVPTRRGYNLVPLHRLAALGDAAGVRRLLEQVGPEKRYKLVSAKNSTGQTSLHWLAYRGLTEVLEFVLGLLTTEELYNALKIQDNISSTALHCAAWRGHTGALRCIANFLPPFRQVELFNIENKYGRTPLDTASHYKYPHAENFIRCCTKAADNYLRNLTQRAQDDVTYAELLRRVHATEETLSQLVDKAKHADVQEEHNIWLTTQVRELIREVEELKSTDALLTNQTTDLKENVEELRRDNNSQVAEQMRATDDVAECKEKLKLHEDQLHKIATDVEDNTFPLVGEKDQAADSGPVETFDAVMDESHPETDEVVQQYPPADSVPVDISHAIDVSSLESEEPLLQESVQQHPTDCL